MLVLLLVLVLRLRLRLLLTATRGPPALGLAVSKKEKPVSNWQFWWLEVQTGSRSCKSVCPALLLWSVPNHYFFHPPPYS